MLIGIKVALLLIALGFGYIVCYLANREEKDLKTIGYGIGVFIILSSAFILVRVILLQAKVSGIIANCPIK